MANGECIAMNVDSCAFLYNKNASIHEKIAFSQNILNVHCPEDILDAHSENAVLQEYYCREILDWVTSKVLVVKYQKNLFDCGTEQVRVWRLLYNLLKRTPWAVSQSVVGSLVCAMEALAKTDATDRYDLLEELNSILGLFSGTGRGNEITVLNLEHGASLLEASLQMYMQCSSESAVLTTAFLVSTFFVEHMDHFAIEKKVWEAIIVRQLKHVCFGAFYVDGTDVGDIKEMRRSIQVSCQSILEYALFSSDTVFELANTLCSPSTELDKNIGRRYTNKLLPILDKMIGGITGQEECLVVEEFFSWLLKSFSAKITQGLVSDKFQPADSYLFFRLASMVQTISFHEDSLLYRMRLLSSLTRQLKDNGLYRPTGSDGAFQISSILQITVYIFECASASTKPEVVSACLEALNGIVVVEHKGMEERLADYWILLLKALSDNTVLRVENCVGILLKEFAALRRLDNLCISLGSCLKNPKGHPWSFILGSREIIASLRRALITIPSGQSIKFIDIVAGWARGMHHSSTIYAATAACLVLQNIPVDLNNARKVSVHTEEMIASIQTIIREHMDDDMTDILSSMLVIQAELLNIRMECSKLDPNIAPLYLQGVRPPFLTDTTQERQPYRGLIEIYASAEPDGGCISLAIQSLSEKVCKSAKGAESARLLYSLVVTLKMYLKVRTEQQQYRNHRIGRIQRDNDESIAGLMAMLSDLIEKATDNYSNAVISRELLFHALEPHQVLFATLKTIYQDMEWLETGLASIQEEVCLKLVGQLVSSKMPLKPNLSFSMAYTDLILKLSIDSVHQIEKWLSRSGSKAGEKRKVDDRESQGDVLLIFEMLMGDADAELQTYGKTLRSITQNLRSEKLQSKMTHLVENYLAELMDSYVLAGLVSKSSYRNVTMSQAIRGICMVHIFFNILVRACREDAGKEMQGYMASIINGLCYQTRLLHMHASATERSQSCRAHQAIELFRMSELLLVEDHWLLENLQKVISNEIELLVCKTDDLRDISKTIRKDTSLTQTRSICSLVQKNVLSYNFVSDYYDDIFYQLAKQAKKLKKTAAQNREFRQSVASLAGALSDSLPVIAVKKDSKVRMKLLEMMPFMFTTSIKVLVCELSSGVIQSDQIRNISGFLETYTRLASSTKPRMSWEGYVNIFAPLSALLYVCPRGVGRGHASRPNAPKEAMIATASSFDGVGEARRSILRAIMELVRSSTRSECIRVEQALSPSSIPFLEILLIMLEDAENGVLKDFLDNHIDNIVYKLLQFIHSVPSAYALLEIKGDRPRQSATEYLHEVRKALLLPTVEETAACHDMMPSDCLLSITIAFRCIESVLCRPTRFKKFPKRFISVVLSAVDSTSMFLSRNHMHHFDTCFIGISIILVGIMRHQTISRKLHLVGLAIQSLQNCLFMFCVRGETPTADIFECFCRVLEGFSSIRAVQPYCKDIILAHIKLFMSPLTEIALESSLPQSLCRLASLDTARFGTVVVPIEYQQLIVPGICALYGVCGVDDVQDIFASLGSQASWQSALNDLKMLYESQFRYAGKV